MNLEKQFPQKTLEDVEKDKLNIYFHISENSGVGYYRQYLPAIKLRESGIANVMISDFKWGEANHIEPTTELLFQIANWADIIVVGRKDQAAFYAQWGGIREFFKLPIILDTDDNVRHVRPYNPGYQGYFPGSEAITWNQYGIAKVFDAITVTTQDLYDLCKKENPKTYILPNMLDIKTWDSFEKKKWDDDKIRFGFIGSAAHIEGINLIKQPVIDILRKYSNTLFYLTNAYMHIFQEYEDLKDRIITIPWIKLQDWPKEVKNLGLDIGLAPLADNMFNRAKSNLRWMEYSAAKMATIASPVKPYLCIKNGEDGFLAKKSTEWFDILEKLILDKELCYNISENAYKRISQDFDIDKHIQLWDKTYKEIFTKYYEFFDPKRIFCLVKEGKNGRINKYKEIRTARRT